MRFLVLSSWAAACAGLSARANTSVSGPITLISGATAPNEMCLAAAADNGGAQSSSVSLVECAAAVAAGDGLEIWKFQSNGQLVSLVSQRCLGLAPAGSRVSLVECGTALTSGGGRSRWEMLGSGQLKLADGGDLCLSQQGPAPGEVNVAANAAAVATSTASLAHGASMTVDGHEGSYWASKFDPQEPVELTVDLGEIRKVHDLRINWEYPAKAFSVLLASSSEQFMEVYATDANVLKETRVPLHSLARLVKIVMHEPHPVHGSFQGHALYAIKSLAVHGTPLETIVEECSKAAASQDARDKYFASVVREHDPSPGKALRSELPALEAAKSALSVAVSELAAVLPDVPACKGAGGLLNAVAAEPRPAAGLERAASAEGAETVSELSNAAGTRSTVTGKAPSFLDLEEVDALVVEARANIVGVRKVLG